MLSLSLPEAQLFNMLKAFFGRDRVIYGMSAYCISHDELKPEIGQSVIDFLKSNNCLFTIIDHDSSPKLIIDYGFDIEGVVDIAKMEEQHQLEAWFKSIKLPYLLISKVEYDALVDPNDSLDLFALLKAYFEIDHQS